MTRPTLPACLPGIIAHAAGQYTIARKRRPPWFLLWIVLGLSGWGVLGLIAWEMFR